MNTSIRVIPSDRVRGWDPGRFHHRPAIDPPSAETAEPAPGRHRARYGPGIDPGAAAASTGQRAGRAVASQRHLLSWRDPQRQHHQQQHHQQQQQQQQHKYSKEEEEEEEEEEVEEKEEKEEEGVEEITKTPPVMQIRWLQFHHGDTSRSCYISITAVLS